MKKTLSILSFLILTNVFGANAQKIDSSALKKTDSIKYKSEDNYVVVKHSYPHVSSEYNFSKLLDGAAPGIQTTNGSGQPGSSSDILIRGMSSLSSNNAPLIVLDGIPYYGDFSSINLNDIASITVLKDATATFGFGNKGGNGVITIATKQKLHNYFDKPKQHLEINAQFGTSTPELSGYKTLNTKQYLETLNTALKNNGNTTNIVDYLGGYNPYNVPNNQLIGSDGKLNPNATLRYQDDWKKEMQRIGIRQNYNVAASGNGTKGSYYLSTNYLNDKGYVKQTDYERGSVRFNGEYNITKWFTVGLRSQAALSSTSSVNQGYDSDLFETSQLIAPVYPVYYRNSNGDKEKDPLTGRNKYDLGNTSSYPNSSIGTRRYYPGSNSLASLFLDGNTSNTNMFILNPYLSLKLPKNFSYSADFNYNYNQSDYHQKYNGIYGAYATTGGANSNANYKLNTLYFRQILDWKKTWNDHEFTWTLGNDYIKQNTKQYSEFTYGNNYSYNTIQEESHSLSYYTKLQYDYKGKFLAFAGIRTDQTLKYFPAIQYDWKTEWAMGGAYVLSEENFFRDIAWVNLLKAKASYGTQGRYFNTYSQDIPAQFVSAPSTGINYGQILVPAPGNQFNAGIEATLFHNALSFEVNFYNKNTGENIELPVFNTSNLTTSYIAYPFKYRNKGVDLNAYTTNINQKHFSWHSTFRLTHNTNKIIEVPEPLQSVRSGLYSYEAGKSMANFNMPEYAGVDVNTGAALYYKNDANGNRITTTDYNSLTTSDFKNAGSAFPKVHGSVTNSFTFKDFEFSFQINYSIGGQYYDRIYQALMSDASQGNNWSQDILKQWSPANRNTNVPILKADDFSADNISTRFLKSASYLSFANLYAGYTFNNGKVKKLKMQSLRVYLSANNLWMIAGRRGMNPQADFYNSPTYVYGPSRNIMLGLNIGI